jgi:hypothetical protein
MHFMAWAFISTHGAVLLAVHRDPNATIDEIADAAGISRRWAIKVVGDLLAAGFLERQRQGRGYRYVIAEHRPLRHPPISGRDVGRLLRLLEPDAGADGTMRTRRADLRDLEEQIGVARDQVAALEEHRSRLETLLRHTITELRRAARNP